MWPEFRSATQSLDLLWRNAGASIDDDDAAPPHRRQESRGASCCCSGPCSSRIRDRISRAKATLPLEREREKREGRRDVRERKLCGSRAFGFRGRKSRSPKGIFKNQICESNREKAREVGSFFLRPQWGREGREGEGKRLGGERR